MAVTIPIHTYVHLYGDLTLDNIYDLLDQTGSNLLQAKNDCVEGKLQTQLGSGYQVVSHAYDGLALEDLDPNSGSDAIVGRNLNPKSGPKRDAYIGYLRNREIHIFDDGKVYPTLDLRDSMDKEPQAVHYVVMSLGGEDFRRKLTTTEGGFFIKFLNCLRLVRKFKETQERYLHFVDLVPSLPRNGKNVRPILMFQYRPAVHHDQSSPIYGLLGSVAKVVTLFQVIALGVLSWMGIRLIAGKVRIAPAVISCLAAAFLVASPRVVPLQVTRRMIKGQSPGMAMLGVWMEKFYRPILEYAQQKKLPILDLPNSFNPFNQNHYISGIEPSLEGGERIARGLAKIIKTVVTPDSQSSTIYRVGPFDTHVSKNFPNTWTVEYPLKPERVY